MRWIAQLLSGLHHIHSHDVLHRDIKSQNIFLKKGGNALIGDFGVSKKGLDSITQVGTPYYYSPEMVNGWKYTKKADIWSLGVLFYEIVTLRFPFKVEDTSYAACAILFSKIVKGIYPDLPSFVDPNVRHMIQSMLVLMPDMRPSLLDLMGYSFARNILVADKILPSGVRMNTNDIGKAPCPNKVTLEFLGDTKKKTSSKDSPTSPASKLSCGRSKSRKQLTIKKVPSPTFTRKSMEKKRVPEEKSTGPSLCVNSKQYNDREREKERSYRNFGDCSSKNTLNYKKPPIGIKKAISVVDKRSEEVTVKHPETLKNLDFCHVSGTALHTQSNSPIKHKNPPAAKPSISKAPDAMALLNHWDAVDKRIGLSDRPTKGAPVNGVIHITEEDDGFTAFTDDDLTSFNETKVVNNKIMDQNTQVFTALKDPEELEARRTELKNQIGENNFAALFDSIKQEMAANEFFMTQPLKVEGVDPQIVSKYAEEVGSMVLFDQVFQDSNNIHSTVIVHDTHVVDNSEVLHIHHRDK